MNKSSVKNIVVTTVFVLFIAAFFLLAIFHTPVEMSESERRPLEQFPSLSVEGVLSGENIADFDDYSADQFPFREIWRKIYAWYRFEFMEIKDTNDLAVEDGYIAKVESGLNEQSVNKSVKKFLEIYEKYLEGNGGKTYLSIIPDKNYFFSKDYSYISMDYERLVKMMTEGLEDFEYIDIFDTLELSDYYKTDTHWSQDKILAVAERLAQKLGINISGVYEENVIKNFYGVYHGQSALDLPPDKIVYLTNEILNSCTVYDYESGKTHGLYTLEKFDSREPYDIFLAGTRALLRIDNPNATTEKEIVVFRDSFGSSLLPILAEGYKSIYVVDIRYVAADMLDGFIDFSGKDTLFLYSTLILNSNPSFK